jgi:glycolate oxidase FAD binding subunit
MATALQPAEPQTFQAAAATLARCSAASTPVRIVGAGTKVGWGLPSNPADVELQSTALTQIVEHNAGDLTAILEAGVPLARAQQTFAQAGQMLALDPPTGADGAATIGGVVATGDSGPLRHRYGAPRDLVVGMTFALGDGTIARTGSKVIKNVAGYDLAKLFAGSFGTLGMILSVSVRLHPLPATTTTALGSTDDPQVLSAGAQALAAAPFEFEAFDVGWHAGRGELLARCGGAEAARRCQRAARLLREHGLEQIDVVADDEPLWERQRAAQRSQHAALIRLAARPSQLAAVVRAVADCDGRLVGRAALGSSFVELEVDAVARLRRALPPGSVSIVLDAPADTRRELDPWGSPDAGALELMRRIKARFDPTGVCNPGLFVGGI